MKAAYIESFSADENIKIGEISNPVPTDNEVCIAVAYAGVNPVDAKIAEGLLQSRLPHQFPLILGWEASGTVHSVGKNVTSFKKGDPVYLYCRKPTVQWGSWAEYLTAPVEYFSPAPKTISMAKSAGVPLAGLTAWQALFEKADLKPNEFVLIHGGGGGVGSFAIQWAALHGAKVITTASDAKTAYVKQLGAHEIIDYKKINFVDQIKKSHPQGIDVVFDTMGGNTYQDSFKVLKPGGRIVSLLEQPNEDLAKTFKVKADYLFVHPDGQQLREMVKLFDSGKASPPITREIPLEQVNEALKEIKSGHTLGKIVLKITTK